MAEKLTLFGEEYQITEGMSNYSILKKEFEKLSSDYGTKYLKEVTNNEAGVREIVERGHKIAQKYFDNAEEVILNKLAENDVYTVTKNEVKNVAISSGVQNVFEETFSEIEEAYFSIVNEAQMARERREIRKESRDRFVGGGFGLRGAMKGIAQASMLNAATGLGHSFINAIGNAQTERQMKAQLDDMYVSVYISLSTAFGSAIKNYFVAAMILLDKHEAMSFALPSKEDEEQAKAIVENIEAGRIPESKIQSVAGKALMLNPFINSTYFTVIEKCGDANQEIEKFADAHGMNGKGIKTGIIRRNFEQKIDDVCEEYEDNKDHEKFDKDLTKIKKDIDKLKKFIGLTVETEYESKINRKLKKIESQFKTVDGVAFKTTKEVKDAKADIQKFYDYIAINGIESESLLDDIRALDFKTKVVTNNLEDRINKMKQVLDDKELGKCIKQIFTSKGFKTTINEDADIEFADKTFIIKTSKYFSENATKARELADIPKNEKIILVFKNKLSYADDYTWWVLTNCNLYMFENDDDKVKEKNVIPYIKIGFIHADRDGNLTVRNRNGVDVTSKLNLEKKCTEAEVREKLSNALQEVYYLIAPLNEGRKKETVVENNSNDLVELDFRTVRGDANWKMATINYEDLTKYACINDDSSEFKALLKKAKEYWNCDFADEVVYFIIVESLVDTSLVFTSKRLYIYGSVESNKNKYVFPIERVSSFQESYGKYGYAMFFDSEYFCQNYFKCSYGDKGHNTLHFEIERIPKDAMSRINYCLKVWIEKITYKFVNKQNLKKELQLEVKNADNLEKASVVLEKIKADKVLDAKDRENLLKQAQAKVDKYENSGANKKQLMQRIDEINTDDLSAITTCLQDVLSNDLLDENDLEVITRLFGMQEAIAGKIYKSELKNFFTILGSEILIEGQPVYTALMVKDIAKKLATVFVERKLNVENGEVPLVYFENPSQYMRMPDKFTLPSAKKGIVTNKRVIVIPFSGSPFIYPLDQVKYDSDKFGTYVSDLNDKLIPFDFPYRTADSIEDKKLRKIFKSRLGLPEDELAASQFKGLKMGVIEKNEEIEKAAKAVSKLPADISEVKTYSREKLEKEYTSWNKIKNYDSKIVAYVTLVEDTLKNTYLKEVGPLCAGLGNKSVEELEALAEKLDKDYPKKFAHLIEKEIKAVAGTLNRKKTELEEELKKREAELEAERKRKEAELEAERRRKEEEALNAELADDKARLSSMNKSELENMIEKWRGKNINKPEIVVVIEEALSLLVEVHKKDLKQWMPENIAELDEEKLDGLIKRYEAGNYDKTLDNEYYVPLIHRKNQFIADRIEVFINFVKSKTGYLGSKVIIATKQAAINQLNSLGKDGDIFVCRMTMGPETCNIYTNKIEVGSKRKKWNEIYKIEYAKKLFKSSINCRCKNGDVCELKITPDVSDYPKLAGVLSDIHEYMIKTGVLYASVGNTPVPTPVVAPTPTQIPVVAPTPTQIPVAAPAQTPADSLNMPDSTWQIKHTMQEAIVSVDKLPYRSRGCLISPVNPKFDKKVKNAIKAYANDVRPEQVFALYDDTVMGSAKLGFVMTLDGITLGSKSKCRYEDIQKFLIKYDTTWKLTTLYLVTKSGNKEISNILGDEGSVAVAEGINFLVKFLFDLSDNPYPIEKK